MTLAGVEIVNIVQSVFIDAASDTYVFPINQRWDRPVLTYVFETTERLGCFLAGPSLFLSLLGLNSILDRICRFSFHPSLGCLG